MARDSDQCLLIFVRFPQAGRVKTRLAQEIGEAAARDLYRCFVTDTAALSRQTNCRTLVLFDPPGAKEAMVEWLGHDFLYEPQQGADLGERMYGALQRALTHWPKAVLVGSDIPDLPPAFIHEAFSSLDAHDAVVGPAIDGGYYLIGFSANCLLPAVFDHMSWGGKKVFESTMKAFEKNALTVHLLSPWRDVDTCEDLKALYLARRCLPPGRLSTVDYLRNHYGW